MSEKQLPYTVIAYQCSSGKSIASHQYAESSYGAMRLYAQSVGNSDDHNIICVLPGHLREDEDISFSGESVVSAEAILESPDVFFENHSRDLHNNTKTDAIHFIAGEAAEHVGNVSVVDERCVNGIFEISAQSKNQDGKLVAAVEFIDHAGEATANLRIDDGLNLVLSVALLSEGSYLLDIGNQFSLKRINNAGTIYMLTKKRRITVY